MNMPEGSDRRPGTDNDGILELMKQANVPVTRQNYIDLNWMGDPPDPWTALHEAELPQQLQDWTKVHGKKRGRP